MKYLSIKTAIISTIVIIVISSNACRKIIPIEIEARDRKIVLNAIISPDTIDARLSLSLELNDTQEDVTYLNDAKITLWKNGTQISTFIKDPIDKNGHYFVSDVIPTQGDSFTIKAENLPYASISASAVIPSAVKIDTITYKSDNMTDIDYTYEVYSFFTTINDPPNQENYYMISNQAAYSYSYFDYETQKDTIIEGFDSYWMESNDPVFESEDSYERYLLFSDELFNGQKKAIKVSIDKYSFWGDSVVLNFQLYSITKEYYLFLKTKQKQENSDEFSRLLGATPVQIYNNVEGGLGYFGGMNYSEKTIIIRDLDNYYKKENKNKHRKRINSTNKKFDIN